MSSSIKGMRQLQARLKAIQDTRPILAAIQLETIAGAKARVPRKTGHLARSIVPGILTAKTATVEARTPYAAAVEFGSRPHVIKPRRGRLLAWPGSASSRRLSGRARSGTSRADMVFARVVHHPGTKAQPYLIPAAKDAIGKHGIRDIVIDKWNDAA